MQTASSRIWTRVVDFISYDDNHYTKCTSKLFTLWFPELSSSKEWFANLVGLVVQQDNGLVDISIDSSVSNSSAVIYTGSVKEIFQEWINLQDVL